jgi:hypothetical protein
MSIAHLGFKECKIRKKLIPSVTLQAMIQTEQYQSGVADGDIPVWLLPGMQPIYGVPGLHDSVPDDTLVQIAEPLATRSFFSESATGKSHRHPAPRVSVQNDWLYGSFVIILFMIVLLRIFYPMQISRLLRTAIFPGKGKSDARVFDFKADTFLLLFLAIYSASFGLLVVSFLAGFRWMPDVNPAAQSNLFFLISAGFLLFILFKLFVIWFTSSIFQTRTAGRFYQDHMLMSAFVTSALIIPLVVMNVFSASLVFLISAGVIIAFMALLRFTRILPFGFTIDSFSYIHFILYFCTLEILPLMIIGKIIFDLTI